MVDLTLGLVEIRAQAARPLCRARCLREQDSGTGQFERAAKSETSLTRKRSADLRSRVRLVLIPAAWTIAILNGAYSKCKKGPRVQRPEAPTGPSLYDRDRHGDLGRCTPRPPSPFLPTPQCASEHISAGARSKTWLPLQQEPYCEAPTGVADPRTTGSSEFGASTQEGGQCWFPANPARSKARLSANKRFLACGRPCPQCIPKDAPGTTRSQSLAPIDGSCDNV